MTAGNRPDSNVVRCPRCHVKLIAEELEGHVCGSKLTIRKVMTVVVCVDAFTQGDLFVAVGSDGTLYRFKLPPKAPERPSPLRRLRGITRGLSLRSL